MTISDVETRVEEIRQAAHDIETAHALEDKLHHDVLGEIAVLDSKASSLGSVKVTLAYAVALAEAALQTRKISFARHCA